MADGTFLCSKNLGDGSMQMFLKIVNGELIENHFIDYSSTVLADWPANYPAAGCKLSANRIQLFPKNRNL